MARQGHDSGPHARGLTLKNVDSAGLNQPWSEAEGEILSSYPTIAESHHS